VRWRLALVSSALTLAILLLFGGLIGKIATDRIRDDFNGEVSSAVKILAGQTQIVYSGFGKAEVRVGPQLDSFVLPDDASARVYDAEGNFLTSNEDAAPLGPPKQGLVDFHGMRVATEPVLNETRSIIGYVQYGRSLDHVEATIERVWFLVIAGILGGTLLAIFAGVAIAGRAMRPIASLTATAREIAATGDPSQRMPPPKADDEVGELARTLEEMLRSLDAAREERENVMQRQREFVADASHELRTPLTSVLANLELLQASLGSPGQAEDREIVDSALRSSKRMGRLVSDLLLLARADAGRLDTHQRINLADVAGDAAAEVAPLMGDRRLLVDNDRPLRVDGSRDELHRMVLNLLDNAIRHTPPGSCVELSLREEGDAAVVEVGDDGPGIPESMRAGVFDRFVRGEGPADRSRGTGTGLGLAIVKKIVEDHGGHLELNDAPADFHGGRGAMISIFMPVAQANPHDAAEPTAAKGRETEKVGNGV
jgi:two-component system OmpR family sensor kinase